eukprot:jgi/Bigna1/143515/aug1.79_g18223
MYFLTSFCNPLAPTSKSPTTTNPTTVSPTSLTPTTNTPTTLSPTVVLIETLQATFPNLEFPADLQEQMDLQRNFQETIVTSEGLPDVCFVRLRQFAPGSVVIIADVLLPGITAAQTFRGKTLNAPDIFNPANGFDVATYGIPELAIIFDPPTSAPTLSPNTVAAGATGGGGGGDLLSSTPVMIGAVVGVVFLVALCICCWCYCKKRELSDRRYGRGNAHTPSHAVNHLPVESTPPSHIPHAESYRIDVVEMEKRGRKKLFMPSDAENRYSGEISGVGSYGKGKTSSDVSPTASQLKSSPRNDQSSRRPVKRISPDLSEVTPRSLISPENRVSKIQYVESPQQKFGAIPVYSDDEIKVSDMVKEGLFGQWYRVLIVETGRQAVLKVPRDGLTYEEIQILKSLSKLTKHGNLVKIIGMVHIQNRDCFMVEYCANGSLDTLHHRINLRQKFKFLRLARDICSGLRCLHSNNFAHGDLACENIMMKSDGTVLISDPVSSRARFHRIEKVPQSRRSSRAQLHSASTDRGDIEEIERWQWVAPESLGNWRFTLQSDLWSLGVTFWEILKKGAKPYSEYKLDGGSKRKNKSAIENVRRGEWTLRVTSIDGFEFPILKQLIYKLLDYEPEERPSISSIIRTIRSYKSKSKSQRSERSHSRQSSFTKGSIAEHSVSHLSQRGSDQRSIFGSLRSIESLGEEAKEEGAKYEPPKVVIRAYSSSSLKLPKAVKSTTPRTLTPQGSRLEQRNIIIHEPQQTPSKHARTSSKSKSKSPPRAMTPPPGSSRNTLSNLSVLANYRSATPMGFRRGTHRRAYSQRPGTPPPKAMRSLSHMGTASRPLTPRARPSTPLGIRSKNNNAHRRAGSMMNFSSITTRERNISVESAGSAKSDRAVNPRLKMIRKYHTPHELKKNRQNKI